MNLPEITFLEASFGGDISFRNAAFGGEANFSCVTFGGRADFRGAEFQRNAFFESALFTGVAEFRGAKFSRVARFGKASFAQVATFQTARFDHSAEFARTRFVEGVIFDGAAFGGEANFDNAQFDGNAKFSGEPGHEGPGARTDTFRRMVAFRGARFKGQAIFTNRRFLDKTDFRNAVFAVAPEFHDCTLHEGTSFAGARFLDREGTREVDAVSAYRTLKLKMAGMRATDEEALFYSLEQRSLRANAGTPTSVKVASWLYEHTADYGRSFLRPLVWIGSTFIAFALVYLAALAGKMVTWADVGTVVQFGLQQVFQPFFIFRTGTAVSGQAVPLWLAFLAAVQSILTFSLLALFLLALRRRFRLH